MVSSTLLISVVGIITAGMVGMTGIVATLLRASISDLGSSLGLRMDRIDARIDALDAKVDSKVDSLDSKVNVIQGAVTDIGARLTRLESDRGGNH